MAPFLYPAPAITGIKEKIDALAVQGDRLYVGTSTGNLHVYSINGSENESTFSLVEVKKALVRRSIEQLGFIKDVNSLVVLSEAAVTLFPLPALSKPTPLVKAKAAFSFAVNTAVQESFPDEPKPRSTGDFARPKPMPTVVTHLIIGCRRKVVIYWWKDGEPQEPMEAPLPHSARIISFINPDTVCFAYSPTEYAIFSIPSMTATDITTPLPVTTSTSAAAMGALTGLTGYMTLGLGSKPKPAAVQISPTEALISKDTEGIVVGLDAKVARSTTIEWPAPPEELAFIKPYIFATLPPGSVPARTMDTPAPGSSTQANLTFIPTTVVQIRSAISLLQTQDIPFPFTSSESIPVPPSGTATTPNATVRLLTASSGKSPLFFVTTPTEKAAAAADGSTIWQCTMKPWAEQIDELIQAGQYGDALAFLDTIEDAVLADKESRRTRIRILNAVSEFRESKFDSAMDTFIELDLNPAKVVALYPEIVAGRLAVPSERWIPLFGGPEPARVDSVSSLVSGLDEQDQVKEKESGESPSLESGGGVPGTGVGSVKPPIGSKGDLSSPPNSKSKRGAPDRNKSVETLVRYLSDRRPKLGAALESVRITPQTQSHKIAPLSETPVEELFALPNAPLSALTPEQLLRCAQIVDTALYKSYLVIRPSLLGSLCRIPNWCEVSEVEEDLRARKKFAELVDLYNGKKMHAQALGLLKQLGEDESDLEDKLRPSIHYLQKLGPEHLPQIFESARWVFDSDADMGFDIFTSEDVDLPRQQVCDFLAGIDPKICARYLEYIIRERSEDTPVFHDRLAELYLSMTLTAKKRGDEVSRQEVYGRLLQFIDSNQVYSVDRLYGLLSSTDLFEARAILLGRLGRHDQALELYVYRMEDYLKAEEYCKRVYQANTETHNVFLTLLRLYLRPTTSTATTADLLSPALGLISRHNPRLDPVETLQLLPPLVTARDVRGFLVEALRQGPRLNAAVVRQVSKAQSEEVAGQLMMLQRRRVKVVDSRICPQCHKRIGNSVIAVHAPRGEVTHYQCREAFSRKLKESGW